MWFVCVVVAAAADFPVVVLMLGMVVRGPGSVVPWRFVSLVLSVIPSSGGWPFTLGYILLFLADLQHAFPISNFIPY